MNYEESLEYLASVQRFGINLGLTRIEKLLQLLGNPERRFRSVHIAGTNGKGSTTAMLSSVLTAAGIRTGMYISPHLDDYTERITIDRSQISRRDFAAAIERTAEATAEMLAAGLEHPTEFELITAAAFYHFAQAGVEYAVIEAGLGGRFDSTNVILPEVAIITNVTMEHADRLGPELTDIAFQKAGIVKPGVPLVTAAKGAALPVIAAEAAKFGAPVYWADKNYTSVSQGISGQYQQISFKTDGSEFHCSIALLGRHQAENAGLALMALRLLAQAESRLTDDAVQAGVRRAVWPGRFEILSRSPVMVVDGAHNLDGARALRQTLDDVFPQCPVTFVLGILADKDVAGIISALVRPDDQVVAVRPDSPRAAEPAAIAAHLRPGQAVAAVSMTNAIELAAAFAAKAGVVCVAGSLYQAGEARKAIEVYKANVKVRVE